jgi:hypothetical protein
MWLLWEEGRHDGRRTQAKETVAEEPDRLSPNIDAHARSAIHAAMRSEAEACR